MYLLHRWKYISREKYGNKNLPHALTIQFSNSEFLCSLIPPVSCAFSDGNLFSTKKSFAKDYWKYFSPTRGVNMEEEKRNAKLGAIWKSIWRETFSPKSLHCFGEREIELIMSFHVTSPPRHSSQEGLILQHHLRLCTNCYQHRAIDRWGGRQWLQHAKSC